MTRTTRALACLATAACAASWLAIAAPATAAGTSYVALGDSYSSGTGTRDYIDDGADCDRSSKAYSSLIAARNGLSLDLVACQGAVTGDVLNGQVSHLSSSTSYVTITIGGNDVGFSNVLTECAKPGWMSDCDGAIDGGYSKLDNELPAKLDAVFDAIATRAPNATVVVAGYPHIFMGEDCNAATFFSPEEEDRLNGAVDDLETLTRSRASAAGLGYVSPVAAFTGHAVCDDPEWVNGLSNPIRDSYHPNVAGHAGYASVIEPALLGSSRAARSTSTAGLPQSRITTDASVRSERSFDFAEPDLTSAKARAAAKQAGISQADLDRLVAAQQAGDDAAAERINAELEAAARN